ncbi:unnamed protein product [Caenorhabditis sp. 36 PRJEB53466]|nr:unnamed protein product [Caenorhabditis sp. 36 PRJEB53466]
MHRAYDPGQTIREKSLSSGKLNSERFSHDAKREMENGVSRSSLVHGTQANPNSDTWYDTDAFLLDQVKEVLNKLSEGSIDDEIWGKIVIMERCKRVAKAYLRKTTVIIDGSEDEFDGKTLGFNHFENPTRDDHTKEIRAKIADGVILKMDYQGNIKGMSRGATPIICQGWKEPRNNCISDRLVRLHGKLNHGASEDEKAYKVFDMRKFKHALERELHDGTPDARTLLLKTCMRIALVKDGADMNRTPCWFAVVNLVALDMIKEKIPQIKSLLNGNALPIVNSPPPCAAPDAAGIDAQTLTQIIAAAVTQANKGAPTPTNNNNSQNLTISPEQLAQIASTISIAQTNTLRTADLVKKERQKKPYHCSTSSLDSSGEDSSGRRSEASTAVKSRAKRWEQVQKTNEREKYTETPDIKILDKSRGARAHRPLLQDVIFTRSHSITSDYDSNKEHFDSGSWSSTQSRYKGGRSTSSSVVSDHELAALARDELKETSEIREANAVSEDDEPPTNPPSPAPSSKGPTLPRKDYNPSPTPTPEHVVVSTQVRSFTASTAEQYQPKLEGAAVWSPQKPELASPLPSPPPPLPKTPQPNNGLPVASLPYNQNNNAFKSNPAFYERHHEMSQLHPRRSEEMEVYFGRSPVQSDPPRNRSSPFVSELRQVLEQRTSGLRIARNHSQPAAAHPSLRPFANARQLHHAATQPYNSASSNCSSGRNTPERAHSQLVASSSHQVLRGLRRTPNQQYQEQQQSQQSTQRLPPYNYGQSTLCREQAPAVRVNRTGSLPWGQWQHMSTTNYRHQKQDVIRTPSHVYVETKHWVEGKWSVNRAPYPHDYTLRTVLEYLSSQNNDAELPDLMFLSVNLDEREERTLLELATDGQVVVELLYLPETCLEEREWIGSLDNREKILGIKKNILEMNNRTEKTIVSYVPDRKEFLEMCYFWPTFPFNAKQNHWANRLGVDKKELQEMSSFRVGHLVIDMDRKTKKMTRAGSMWKELVEFAKEQEEDEKQTRAFLLQNWKQKIGENDTQYVVNAPEEVADAKVRWANPPKDPLNRFYVTVCAKAINEYRMLAVHLNTSPNSFLEAYFMAEPFPTTGTKITFRQYCLFVSRWACEKAGGVLDVISPENQQKLFEMNFQMDTAEREELDTFYELIGMPRFRAKPSKQ